MDSLFRGLNRQLLPNSHIFFHILFFGEFGNARDRQRPGKGKKRNYQPGLTSGYTRFPLPFHSQAPFLFCDRRARVEREPDARIDERKKRVIDPRFSSNNRVTPSLSFLPPPFF